MNDAQDDLNDWEYPEPDTETDETETIDCPACHQPVYDDAEQCPYCGDYITVSTSPWAGRPWWWIAIGLLGLIAVIAILSGILAL